LFTNLHVLNYSVVLAGSEMSKPMQFVALTAVLCCFLPTTVTATSGDWGEIERCPEGEVAFGFSLKIQQEEEDGAVTGISLRCTERVWIYSAQGS
jgi:hypothetical protein